MQLIDLLLELLDDKKGWCNIEEIINEAAISKTEALEIINFLARHRFIILDEHLQKAKIANEVHEFLTEIGLEERRVALQRVARLSPRRSLKAL